jgi:hypothetical protein
MKSHLLLYFFLALLSACSTSSRQIVGEKRTPISPEQVTIYRQKPANYEQIAFIQASSKNSLDFSDQAMQNVIIDRSKQEAANLGANGVLLQQTEEEITGFIGSGSVISGRNVGIGIGLSFPITNQFSRSVAIYVTPLSDSLSTLAEPINNELNKP